MSANTTPPIAIAELPVIVRKHIRDAHETLTDEGVVPKKHAAALLLHLESLAATVFSIGVDRALGSEEKVWKRATDLEDVIIELVRYAPGSTMMKARALAADIEAGNPAEATA